MALPAALLSDGDEPMTHPSKIISFMACRRCTEQDKRTRISAGLIDPYTLRLWCDRHNMLIAEFTLAIPVTPRCDICGEEIGLNHEHKH